MTEKKSWGGKRREGRTQTKFTIRIDNDLYEKIEDIAIATNSKKGSLINALIRKALNL